MSGTARPVKRNRTAKPKISATRTPTSALHRLVTMPTSTRPVAIEPHPRRRLCQPRADDRRCERALHRGLVVVVAAAALRFLVEEVPRGREDVLPGE
jgi:hypothetical protein